MEMYELTEELQKKCRRRYRLEKIKQYSLVLGGAIVAVTASALLVKEAQKEDEK